MTTPPTSPHQVSTQVSTQASTQAATLASTQAASSQTAAATAAGVARQGVERRGKKPPRLPSVCPHDCPSTCALEVEVIDGHTIGRVYGAKGNSYTEGVICAKVSRYADRIHHPDRLTQPLRRVGAKGVGVSAFETISWDDALDEVSARFRQVIDRHGPEAIWPYHYAGTMGLIQRDGIERFRNMLGTSQQHSTFCTTLADAGWRVGTGAKTGADVRNMCDSDVIVMWGGNPVNTQVNVMHHIAKARRNNNAKLIVVDPYRTGTAAKADQHLMLRPGTDGALACAVMNVLLAEGFADREYLARMTDFSSEVESHLAQRTPAWASGITGLSVESIEKFARTFGASRKTFVRCGYGFSRSRNGATNMHAVTCLPAITGAWQEKGGGALYSHAEIYRLDENLIQRKDHRAATARVLDQSRIGEVLCGNEEDLQGGPPIDALFIQNTNPAVVAPDSRRVLQGLQRDDLFICVHEQFMTETAAMADIVLPATMFLEHDDIYKSGGHTHLQVARKVVDSPGQCRSNHEVLAALAARLGFESAADAMSEAEIITETLAASTQPNAEALEKEPWLDCAQPFEQANFLTGFATRDGKFHFKPDWSSVGGNTEGMPELPDHWNCIDIATPEHPYRLIAAPARQFLNTTFTETDSARKMEKSPRLKVHPEDCATLAVSNGDRVAVGNKQGEIQLEIEEFDGQQRGTVVCESIWPNRDFGNGLGVNTLISSKPAQPNGGAVFHDTAVWIRPL